MKKIAVVLFNLGGPDKQESVQPFLFNLFCDPAIIRLPQPLRFLIAKLISIRRAPIAKAIYAQLGGGSPILKNTQDQAKALENELNILGQDQYKTFIAMRYWHPFAEQTAREVKKFDPDEIVLLPLYPQFSTTTTQSSLKSWHEEARKIGIKSSTKAVCCYPREHGFIQSLACATKIAYEEAKMYGMPRILFSAHGLPEKIIKNGDPYQVQCMMTVDALRRELNIEGLDSTLCFQSRVGPLKWITPATDEEIRRAAKGKIPLVVVPVAFVSDHSETLVELDIEYRHLALSCGAPFYACVAAVGIEPKFIKGLARLTHFAVLQNKNCISGTGERICPADFLGCPCINSSQI